LTAQILPSRTNSKSPVAASFGDPPSTSRWRTPVATSTASIVPAVGGRRFVTSTARAPGRNSASLNWPMPSPASRICCTAPPLAGTRDSPGRERTIESSSPHVPRVLGGALASTTGTPPSMDTRFNWLAVKKPIDCPSGEKNGRVPPSVPRIGSPASSFNRRRSRPGPVPPTT
jgi:hypothetical protein